ncbi:MAG: hypothetical protein IPM50_04955 [Acidobacteriota bacterium]|nr:MAG: hypothetical protein IPM50_04955 [Acidobacteriota bacterium]
MRSFRLMFFFAAALSMLTVSTGISQVRSDRVQPPENYKFDGCSLFPDGDWGECCEAHDRDYFVGGTKAERKASDRRLRQCVRAKGHKYISVMMYFGVRIGGVSFLPTPFRWGFGQPQK